MFRLKHSLPGVSDDFLASQVDEHLEAEREVDAEYDESEHSQHFCTLN
jgi:hypothetical protein